MFLNTCHRIYTTNGHTNYRHYYRELIEFHSKDPFNREVVMPVNDCMENNKKGYKWGSTGKCYTYDDGDDNSKEEAYSKMMKQARAIEASKSKQRKSNFL